MDFEEAKRVLAALDREGVHYVLVGSMAMAAQGIIRATRDLDFFVAPDAENVARLRRALTSLFGDDPNIDQITSEDLAGAYPAIEYVRRMAGIRWTYWHGWATPSVVWPPRVCSTG